MKKLIIAFLSVAVMSGCSSRLARDEGAATGETQKMTPMNSPEDIAMSAASIFQNAPNLTDEQKDKIHDIYTKAYDDSMAIQREIGQNHSLLYMTLVKQDYKSSEVDRLTKKIVALDKKRLDMMFKTLKEVQKIVGHASDKGKIYKQLGKSDENSESAQ